MAIFWFHIVLISSSILLAFGMAARFLVLAGRAAPARNGSVAVVALAVGISLGIYLWTFVRRGSPWKR